MKKILLTLALAFCCVAGQGQTTAIPAGVNIQELNTKWANCRKEKCIRPEFYGLVSNRYTPLQLADKWTH